MNEYQRTDISSAAVLPSEDFLVVRTFAGGALCGIVIESAPTATAAERACETLSAHDAQHNRDDRYQIKARCTLWLPGTVVRCALPADHDGRCQ